MEEDATTRGIQKNAISSWLLNNFLSTAVVTGEVDEGKKESRRITRPVFPLATSESQDRIADLLLRQKYPAVIAEGPPGTLSFVFH